MLRDEFQSIESQMKEKLSHARARFTHPGDKGTKAEEAFREFLRQYLPRRLAVGQGEIIDVVGHRSKQTDVVIANEDHPFTFTEDSPGLFFIEGVVGAGDVKATLTRDHLEQSIRNSRTFKALEVSRSKGATAMGTRSDLERYYRCPPWFLFAYESQLGLSTICERLIKESQHSSGTATNLVDAVFVLGKGWVINFGDGQESFQFEDPTGKSVAGWAWQQGDSALFELMAWLSIVMPRVIRYESILAQYLLSKA
jgi:Domain of unknown function (DUF6602)